MIIQELFDWLVDPAGGGQFLAIALASWLVEARDFWSAKVSSKQRSIIMGVLSLAAVVWANQTGAGNIDELFADAEAGVIAILTAGAVWMVSQVAHKLNPRR